MNETMPRSARALGSVRRSALGPKQHPPANRSFTRAQSASDADTGNTVALNLEIIAMSRSSKRLKAKAASRPVSLSSPVNSILSTKAVSALGIEPVTGLQFRVPNGKPAHDDDSLKTARIWKAGGPGKSEKKKDSERRSVVSTQPFSTLSRQMDTHRHQKRNYLEDGDFVKGRGHRIDTGPMSRPVSGWLNRESRNAVELAEKDEGQRDVGRYYRLDVDTGAVTARHLCNGESIIIGVNGKERKRANGGGSTGDDEAEELAADAEEPETPRDESYQNPTRLVPLSWSDQFKKPTVRVVKPRLPSAQSTSPIVSETKPVMFRTSSQRDIIRPSVTKIQTPSKENYASLVTQKKTGENANKKQQNVKFDEFLQHPIKNGESTISEGENRLDNTSFRYKSAEIRRTRSSSCSLVAGIEKPVIVEPQIVARSRGWKTEAHDDMIVVGSSQISAKTAEIETPVTRGESGAEKHISLKQRNGCKIGREAGYCIPKEVTLINIVHPIRTRQESEESANAGDVTKTSEAKERKNGSVAIRLRYSVRNPRASTGTKRGHPEGLYKGPVVGRSSAVREGKVASLSREDSANEWSLNGGNAPPEQHGEAPPSCRPGLNKTVDCSSEVRFAKQVIKENRNNSSLSQAFDVVQLSPTRVKTAPVQNRTIASLEENPYDELRVVAMETTEVSPAPPPSRAVTPNVRSPSAKSILIAVEAPIADRDSRRSLHIPTADSLQMSECDEPQVSPQTVTDEEEILRREQSEEADAWKSSDAVERRSACRPDLQPEKEEKEEKESTNREGQLTERQSPIA